MIIGIVLIVCGIAIRYIAIKTLGSRFTLTLQYQDVIVKKGIYRYLRHPSYAGSFLMILGASLLHPVFGTMWITYAFFRARTENEEVILGQNPEYEKYKQRTGRFLPKILELV